MNRIRLQIPTATAKVTTVYLEPMTPLDGHGGRLRQRFAVFNRHYEEIGKITRHRTEAGTVTHWTATGDDLRQFTGHSRGAALHHLIQLADKKG